MASPDLAADVGFESPPPVFFFTHNVQVLALLWAGVFSLGLSTLGGLLLNGLSVGSVVFSADMPVALRLALFLPHGLVELPAIWIGGAVGFRIPFRILTYLYGTVDQPVDENAVADTLVLVALSLLLIAVAAYIEALITPVVGGLVGLQT